MTFQKIINSDMPVLVDLLTKWSEPCKLTSLILEEFRQRIGDEACYIDIHVDNKLQAAPYQVRGVPTSILYKNGEAPLRQSIIFPPNELERLINKNN